MESKIVVNSDKPPTISWIFSKELLQQKIIESHKSQVFSGSPGEDAEETKGQIESEFVANLGLTMCPGKNLAAGRDGKSYTRDIRVDVGYFASQGIKLIVCLLNDYEVRTVGCNIANYEKACKEYKIELYKYPIIEMAPPDDINKFHNEVVLKVENSLNRGEKVISHCRGGIGRAGLLASCICLFRFRKE